MESKLPDRGLFYLGAMSAFVVGLLFAGESVSLWRLIGSGAVYCMAFVGLLSWVSESRPAITGSRPPVAPPHKEPVLAKVWEVRRVPRRGLGYRHATNRRVTTPRGILRKEASLRQGSMVPGHRAFFTVTGGRA